MTKQEFFDFLSDVDDSDDIDFFYNGTDQFISVLSLEKIYNEENRVVINMETKEEE